MIRYACKLTAFLALSVAYIISSAFIKSFTPCSKQRRRKLLAVNTSRFCRVLLRLLGISLSIKPQHSALVANGRMILVNHLSYLDVAVLSAILPAVFVTSYEVLNSPVEGLLARCGGSVFVDRRNKTTVVNDIRILASLLKQGFTVVLFPEATSSSGERVLPFKSALLNAALEARVEILPACLNYRAIDGCGITVLNRDKVFYYGEMQFMRHILGLLRLRKIDLELAFLDSVPAEIISRKRAAKAAFDCISSTYIAVH